MHPIFLCMVAGTLFGAGLSISTEPTPEPRQQQALSKPTLQDLFKAADLDGDGMLDKAEAQAARLHSLVDNFGLLDSDHDGRLTQAEIRPLLRPRLSA